MDRAAERFFLLVRKYLEVHLPHRRGVSPQTVRSYRQALSQYVDYLIDDEFSRNKSQAARRSSREYLHVIQGGSQSLKSTAKLHRTRQRGAQAAYKPRHMASMVREA